jgi:DNA-nicking Smr family endonuclease
VSTGSARATRAAQGERAARASTGSLHGLAALGTLRDAMRERAEAARLEAEREARRMQAERRAAQCEQRAFAEAVGAVTPLAPHNRRLHGTPKPPPLARQRELDEQAALREAWSDAVDIESLLHTDAGLGFHRSGVGPDVLARLRRGRWTIQAQLDLHGLRREDAREALMGFLAEAQRQGKRCLRVVHGKGNGSPGREPVLKAKVQRWLAQSDAVIAFAQASGPQGGAGALIVLLGSAAR